MIRLKFFILLVACGLWLFPFVGNAQTSSSVDCTEYGFAKDPAWLQLYPSRVRASILARGERNPVLFTDADMQQAARYLGQYCCESISGQEGCDALLAWQNNYYPESPYIFDHLINIGMRKLDGIQEHCDALGISCTATTDYQLEATARREKITEIAEDTEWYPPLQIESLFKDYRWTNDTFLEKDTLLSNAYFLMCDEAVSIRNAIWGNSEDTDRDLTDGKSLKTVCDELVKKRYEMELQYVRTLMVEKWLQYMSQNLRSYLFDYYLENRMSDLVDKYNNLYSCFVMVLRYSERTKCCNE